MSPSFADNLKSLPRISHLAAINLLDAAGNIVARIENKPGAAGSLAIYNHLGQIYGAITVEAAKKGLELYAEHSTDAQAHPGKHPNIDRLAGLVKDGGVLRVKHEFAVDAAPAAAPTAG